MSLDDAWVKENKSYMIQNPYVFVSIRARIHDLNMHGAERRLNLVFEEYQGFSPSNNRTEFF